MRTMTATWLRGIARLGATVFILLWPGNETSADPLFKISDGVFSSTGGFAESASFRLLGSASSGTAETQRLGLVVQVNQTAFSIGQTLNVTAGITNPGLPGAADVYVGMLRPDGAIEFFTSDGVAVGNIANPASLRAIAVGVSLGTGFSVIVPNFRSHVWTGSEVRGDYTAFLFAVTTGALTDGVVGLGELLGIATAVFSFP